MFICYKVNILCVVSNVIWLCRSIYTNLECLAWWLRQAPLNGPISWKHDHILKSDKITESYLISHEQTLICTTHAKSDKGAVLIC